MADVATSHQWLHNTMTLGNRSSSMLGDQTRQHNPGMCVQLAIKIRQIQKQVKAVRTETRLQSTTTFPGSCLSPHQYVYWVIESVISLTVLLYLYIYVLSKWLIQVNHTYLSFIIERWWWCQWESKQYIKCHHLKYVICILIARNIVLFSGFHTKRCAGDVRAGEQS